MSKAKRLPSGSWRCRVYSHTDSDGKKIYESFTASTRNEAELLAAQFKNGKTRRAAGDLTLSECISGYIESRKAILSPATVRTYNDGLKRINPIIGKLKVKRIDTAAIQSFISGLAADGYSASTIKTTYGVLSSALIQHNPEFIVVLKGVRCPAIIQENRPAPSTTAVKTMLKESRDDLKKSILLGACGCRAGEVCALKYGDVDGLTVSVHADMVRGIDGKWQYKPHPKTSASIRTFELPEAFRDIIGDGAPDEYIITRYNPNSLSLVFSRFCKKHGIEIHFHELRHFYASLCSALNVPDVYTSSLGGWSRNSRVLKSVYQHEIPEERARFQTRINKGLSDLL